MVNGNYIIYGDRPYSDSEIVSDHVHSRPAERRPRRQAPAADPRQQLPLDNETDTAKYEKRVNEPRLLRYVPKSDVEEHYVIDKFETYDLKPTEATPRRYAFKKKPWNPADGSVNYAYSRSSSSCSSPGGNLPPIAEHEPARRARSPPTPQDRVAYDTKLDKYFTKPKEINNFSAKGSHPDSLYRVPADGGAGAGSAARVLRLMRWPLALVVVCAALAVFVYFLMPDNLQSLDVTNATYWESNIADADTHRAADRNVFKSASREGHTQDPRTSEIDFHDADDGNKESTVSGAVTDEIPQRKLPAPPVFPTHLTPEVQYGNEDADAGNARSPKNMINQANFFPVDSTLKLYITQKPEKPFAIYFKDGEGMTTTTTSTTEPIIKETVNDSANRGDEQSHITLKPEKPLAIYYKDGEEMTTTTTTTEAITKAKTDNVYANYGDKQPADKNLGISYKPYPTLYPWAGKENNIYVAEPGLSPEIREYYNRIPLKANVNHTSGHSKLFGISIEDAEKMQSTTQSSVYNTRVSPTLPTWRDGDDTTTKKYPVNLPDVSQCRSTSISLCRGVLPYDLASKPATFKGVLISSLLPQIEYVVAINCSARFKNFVCALLEPECSPPPQAPKMPCYNLCKAVLDGCENVLPDVLAPALDCRQYTSANCVGARAPCSPHELACSDGSCIPRDWICDGTRDCPAGEDEELCAACQKNEFRCQSGACISKRWLCDGYADCADGDDEAECAEQGGQAAGSAPAPAVQPAKFAAQRSFKTRDNDSSKELLITSDSNNALKRNFTRRPPVSRLSPYYLPMIQHKNNKKEVQEKAPKKVNDRHESAEDVNADDLGLFGDTVAENIEKEMKAKTQTTAQSNTGRVPLLPKPGRATTSFEEGLDRAKLERTINKLERVIDGAALLKKTKQAPTEEYPDSIENTTVLEKQETTTDRSAGRVSAHASPCPSGELRCVDGRCITLAQLCDGTIDCSDHADEDNCYT